MKTYSGWHNIPGDMSTKTRLRNEFGLKPSKSAEPVAIVKAQYNNKWNAYNLYRMDDCIEIKKRKIDISDFEMDNKTIADALYIINKSAKVSRDTKVENYKCRQFKVVNAAKTRQLKHYALKDEVINKLKIEDRIKLEGYHKQFDNYLLTYRLEHRIFHLPVKEVNGDISYLGSIEEVISSEKRSINRMNYYQARKLLEQYVGWEVIDRINK